MNNQMNKSLNFTALRLSPIKALIELQHQTNHYKNIINPRKLSSHQTSRQQSNRKTYSSYIQNKFQKQKRQSITRQNKRILKDCVQIYKGKGILQKAEEQFKSEQNSPKKTLVNSYKAKQKRELLRKQNKTLRQKIQKLKPLIGDNQQWKRHSAFTSQLIDKFRNKIGNKFYNYYQNQIKMSLGGQAVKTNFISFFKTLNLKQTELKPKQKNRQIQVKTVKTALQNKNKKRKAKKQTRSQSLNIQAS